MVSLPQTMGQRAESFSVPRENFYCLFTGARRFPLGRVKKIWALTWTFPCLAPRGAKDSRAVRGEPRGAQCPGGVGEVMPRGDGPVGRAGRLCAGLRQRWGGFLRAHPLLQRGNSVTVEGKKPFFGLFTCPE